MQEAVMSDKEHATQEKKIHNELEVRDVVFSWGCAKADAFRGLTGVMALASANAFQEKKRR